MRFYSRNDEIPLGGNAGQPPDIPIRSSRRMNSVLAVLPYMPLEQVLVRLNHSAGGILRQGPEEAHRA
jgi:hypothetical protein